MTGRTSAGTGSIIRMALQFLRRVGRRGQARQVPQQTPVTAPAAGPAGMNARTRRVFELLVNRYGYPVNGAAGIVGNLIAESALLPNRIEGSRPGTPMRARDFAGQVREFTLDEIRDRSRRMGIGPDHPGIGIAQWTTAERRAGLFEHTIDGQKLGTGILSNLDAQVDYLVTELRSDYRRLNATLMSPGVGVEQATDAVLLRFEVPGSVINRPTTDPAVQAVLATRRNLATQALHTYQTP